MTHFDEHICVCGSKMFKDHWQPELDSWTNLHYQLELKNSWVSESTIAWLSEAEKKHNSERPMILPECLDQLTTSLWRLWKVL